MRPCAKGVDGELDAEIPAPDADEARPHRSQVDYREVVARIRQERIRDLAARPQKREGIHAPGDGARRVAQRQTSGAADERDIVGSGRYRRRPVRQDLPRQVNVVRGVGDVDVTVELDSLQPEAVAASAAAVEGPDGQLRGVNGQLHLERRAAVARYDEARGRAQGHGPARRVVRVAERRRDRVGAGRRAVVVHLDRLAEALEPRRRQVAKGQAPPQISVTVVPRRRRAVGRPVHANFAPADPGDRRQDAGLQGRVDHDVRLGRVHQNRLDLGGGARGVLLEQERRRARDHGCRPGSSAEGGLTRSRARVGRDRCAGRPDVRLDRVVADARTARRGADHTHDERRGHGGRAARDDRSGDIRLDRVGEALLDHQGRHERVATAEGEGDRVTGRHQPDQHPDGPRLGGAVHLEADVARAAVDQGDLAGGIGEVRIATRRHRPGRTAAADEGDGLIGEAGTDRRPIDGLRVCIGPGNGGRRADHEGELDRARNLGLRDADDLGRRTG